MAEYGVELAVGAEVVAAVATNTPSPASSAASFTGRAAQELSHDVYLGFENGKPVYVGITNDLARRAGNWAGKYNLQGITSCKVTKDQARGIEQALIEKNPDFNNKINSISPTRPWYDEAVSWGRQWLSNHGF